MPPRSTKTVAGARPQPRKIGKDSPMMEQFWRAKKEAPDALLFFRMGELVHGLSRAPQGRFRVPSFRTSRTTGMPPLGA